MPRAEGVPENLKPFKKGEDSRRNLKGRPKKLPSLDVLLPEILGDDKDNNSRLKQILEKLAHRALNKGGDRAAEILLERAFGKAKETVKIDNEVIVTIRREP